MRTTGIVAWVLAGLCALAGTAATYLPEGEVQDVADKGAQLCEAGGFVAYPRDTDGGVMARPPESDGARRVGMVRHGTGFAPVLVPAGRGPEAHSSVEDVGAAE